MPTKQTINRFLIVCGGSGINLLGQLRILGFNAEMQIDAGGEILDVGGEPRRFPLKLDEHIGAVADLLFKTKERIVEKKPKHGGKTKRSSDKSEEPSSVYLQEAITHPSDIAHINFLADKWVGSGKLKDGLAQAPAIGGAAIKHPLNATKLKNELSRMLAEYGVAPGVQYDVEFWIVSSTAGGTGEGIHRFVGAMAAEVARERYPEAPVAINFIRIGSLTFSGFNLLKTTLNTLFGIAADAAVEKRFKHEFPKSTVNWYYIDLPDVGKDDIAKRVRAEMIEMAGKAIMLPDLSEDLKKLLINNGGAKAIVVRTGFWGRDFSETVKYFETLTQLRKKLKELISPESAHYVKEGQPKPDFNEQEWEITWAKKIRTDLESSSYLQQRIEDAWSFPKYQGADLLDKDAREKWIGEWKSSVRALIGEGIEGFAVPWMIEKVRLDDQGQKEPRNAEIDFSRPAEKEELFERIDDAHLAIAWCARKLGTGAVTPQAEGYLKDLHTLATKCSGVMHPIAGGLFSSPEAKAKKLVEGELLWNFVKTLIKVNKLIEVETGARRVLDSQLEVPRKVQEFVEIEFRNVKGAVEGASSPVLAADLSKELDRLEGKSWLELLDRAVRLGDRRVFRQEVLKGATGLKLAGLKTVLGLEQAADIAMIRKTIDGKVGNMTTPHGKEYEAPWWRASTPEVEPKYKYRILPELEPGVEEKLRADAGSSMGPTYKFTKLGIIGLYVLAFEAVSLNKSPGPDTTSVFVYLMRPIVQILRDHLQAWELDEKTGRGGMYEIASAGVIGDPLDKRVLREGGLNKSHIERIGEFYQFLPED